ncbi:unnamed protein product, partial [Mesorhabditis spiculigera]
MSVSFVPLTTVIDTAFWDLVNKGKLNHWKLDEAPIFQVVSDGTWLEEPALLNTFVLTVHADLKKFVYSYWNCIPAVGYPENVMFKAAPKEVEPQLNERLVRYYQEAGQLPIFVYCNDSCVTLAEWKNAGFPTAALVVADPSTEPMVPGWTVRNALAAFSMTTLNWEEYNVISLRAGLPSLYYSVSGATPGLSAPPKGFGWERSSNGKLEPTRVEMKSQFDPISLMEQSVDLNLSLIKWRLVPELRLERFKALRVLIFGAGTLGCNLARSLLGWGVRHFTLVDNSNVSYSNPVRQSLSEFEDARLGRPKAECAAEALRRILPTVFVEPVQMTVPMPGHTVSKNGEAELEETVRKLDELIQKHDVVYLALDSREARWLPTVAFSVALGFDTYVIIRHGIGQYQPDQSISPTSVRDIVPYPKLACYFCSDVTAPGNSTTDRTLDQQCTVARAGLSMIASGLAVELLSSVLQHETPLEAPAFMGDGPSDEAGGLLGCAPHQIRGFIHRFQQMTPCVRRFDRCIACGFAVCDAFVSDGWRLVRDAMNSPATLEKISGLDQLQASVEEVDIDFASDDGSSVISGV